MLPCRCCWCGPCTPGLGATQAIALAPAAVGACALAEPCPIVALAIVGAAAQALALHLAADYLARNIRENKQFKEAARQIERTCGKSLTPDQRRRLHDLITKQGFSLKEIVEIGVGEFCR